jgi:hypothetical protein
VVPVSLYLGAVALQAMQEAALRRKPSLLALNRDDEFAVLLALIHERQIR